MSVLFTVWEKQAHHGCVAASVTVLLAINQSDLVLRQEWPPSLAWKGPLTYLVPFVVATWGVLVNGRLRRRSREAAS